jgi:hypothetical protein
MPYNHSPKQAAAVASPLSSFSDSLPKQSPRSALVPTLPLSSNDRATIHDDHGEHDHEEVQSHRPLRFPC